MPRRRCVVATRKRRNLADTGIMLLHADHAHDFAGLHLCDPEVAPGRGEIGQLDVVDVEARVVGRELPAEQSIGVEAPDDVVVPGFTRADLDGAGVHSSSIECSGIAAAGKWQNLRRDVARPSTSAVFDPEVADYRYVQIGGSCTWLVQVCAKGLPKMNAERIDMFALANTSNRSHRVEHRLAYG